VTSTSTHTNGREAERLAAAGVTRHLETAWLGRELRLFDAVDSTNTVARSLAGEGAAHGTVVIAESQTSGRGRLGRGWVSPPHRNLYVSVVLRSALPPARLAEIGLMAGVAACDALGEWCRVRIKWPNDVLWQGRKLAGILAEMEGPGALILGIGVNVNSTAADFPEELRDKACSLRMATATMVDRARVAGRLLTHLERWHDRLCGEGFAAVAAAWSERTDLIGLVIRVREPAAEVSGEVLGLDDDGALRLLLADGSVHRVVSGDVTVVGGYRDDSKFQVPGSRR
jgi:BirA family transcriptional regulator, biotin operon repressor / biotin---[acetyl-CoA-carboxylase] ligase